MKQSQDRHHPPPIVGSLPRPERLEIPADPAGSRQPTTARDPREVRQRARLRLSKQIESGAMWATRRARGLDSKPMCPAARVGLSGGSESQMLY